MAENIPDTPEEKACYYSGGTLAVDPYGNIMAEAKDHQQDTLTIELDMERLRHFRKKFPVGKDAD